MDLQKSITASIYPGEETGYVAECVEISVVTQGNTLDEVVRNLKEAVALHLEEEDPKEFGLINQPSLTIILELQPEYA
jgi:predicted RNase H-like HicB family nuclease